jgi:Uma2 family endonuclease
MTALTLKPMSVEEYLRTEEASPVKREYVGGFVYPLHGATRAQAGASQKHTRIVRNIMASLEAAALRLDCRLHSSDMKLRIEGSRSFYYPDVMAVCGQPIPHDYYETAPCLLNEVISPRTAQVDRQTKYAAYTALPSLHTYLIVEQAERRVYAYQRHGNGWRLEELASSGSVHLPCLEHTLTLDDIYADLSI